jgi:hypothetical protein
MAKSKAFQGILDHYGVENAIELMETEELNHDMHDSVQPGFCKECGEMSHDVEPDARGYTCQCCEADNAVSSIAVHLGVI